MQVIPPAVGDARGDAGELASGRVAVVRALLLAGQLALGPRQARAVPLLMLRMDTNHRSAQSRDTVTVDGCAPSGNGRDHTMLNGSRIFTNLNSPSRYVKPDLVYSADWRDFFRDLKRGYFARLSKTP
ncbi:hypothetical protein NAB29_18705 [Proteus mirabilis]|nr:hypothetical protein [Proteus mirabilis]